MRFFKRPLLFLLLVLGPWSVVRSPALALEDIYVIQFVLDGVHREVLTEEVRSGRLPNLKKYFLEEGAIFEKARTTFPTVSSPGYISFATGLSAGHSGVFFLEWFDRTQQKVVGYLTPNGHDRVNQDLLNRLALHNSEETELNSPLTLFEILHPAPTAALYTPFHRGAVYTHPKKFPVRGLFSGLVAKDGFNLNRLAMRELGKLFSKSENKIPRYTLVGLYGTDFYGHSEGPHSEEVRLVLQQFDHLFAGFVETLRQKKIADKTYLIVTSDHGMHPTGKELELRDYLWKKGLRPSDKIYLTNRGVSSAFIYLAGSDGWEDIPDLHRLRHYPAKGGPIDLIGTLIKNEGVDWIAARDDFDRVRIYNAAGEGVIAQLTIGGQKFYSYLYKGEDPLGLAADPSLENLLDGKPYPAEVWLEKTVTPIELSHLFTDPRAGDILVAADGAYSFRTAKAGTHGSLTDDDMRIPLWIAGPGIPTGRFGEARSVDLYPTVLGWFGLWGSNLGKNQEGKVLFAEKNNTEKNPTAAALAEMEAALMELPPLFKLPNRDEVAQRLRKMIPGGLRAETAKECETEIEARYRRWKKLDGLEEKIQNPQNPLEVPPPLKGNMRWLLANEKNIEFLRLRRMEDIKSILEERGVGTGD
ncbi:MAG: alkaline phosphatase family protein [Deltaproteobacteria bacterium]|nr:alkaline phosphatase family protein [Deltaproteobacteria bacterium]